MKKVRIATKGCFGYLYIFDYMRFITISLLVAAVFLLACEVEENAMKVLDLAPYGLPLSIFAPDSTEVQVKEYPFMRDINIRKDDHFHIQLYELPSGPKNPEEEKQRQIIAIKKDPTFLEIIKEYDKGFIYSKQADSIGIDYDFRYVRYIGDKQLIFQSAVLSNFPLAEIEQMVEAIRDQSGD